MQLNLCSRKKRVFKAFDLASLMEDPGSTKKKDGF